MKVVLTGGRGLIGRALHTRLVQEGHKVVLLVRPEWDGERDVPSVETLEGTDAVIHLAGENVAAKRWTADFKRHLIDSRVQSAFNLKTGLERAGVKPELFLSASGIGYYGDRGDEVLNENSAAGSDFLAELCVAWEGAADRVSAGRTVKCRFGAVLSPKGGLLGTVVPMFRKFGASRIGSGKQWLSWIHIEDVVEGILFILKRREFSGALNFCSPQPIINAQWTEELRDLIGAFKAPPVPAFALKLALGGFSEVLLASQRAEPARLAQLGFAFRHLNFQNANKKLVQFTS